MGCNQNKRVHILSLSLPPSRGAVAQFGVDVQQAVGTVAKSSAATLKACADGFDAYFFHRATAVSKHQSKKTIETVEDKGTKRKVQDGEDETESTEGSMRKESHVQPEAVPDMEEYIIALDTKWYFSLRRILEDVRDELLFVIDAVMKNRTKVERPRGETDERPSYF